MSTETPLRPFVAPSRVVAGTGAAAQIGSELRALTNVQDPGLVVVVGDAAVLELGPADALTASLELANFDVEIVAAVAHEPTPDTVVQALSCTGGRPVSAVVAVGGGSAIDTAKLVAVSLTNPIALTEGLAATTALAPVPPLIAVPTTAGTGAEATAVAMLWDSGEKRIFVHSRLVPVLAILDPTLAASAPPSVIAASGLDAISHAIEAYVSTFRMPITADQSTSALRRLAPAIRVAHDSDDPVAHLEMLVGAYEAGLALNASVVLGHSLAYTIAARTQLPHGVTCAMTLPYCLAYCRPAADDSIASLGPSLGLDPVADEVIDWILDLTADLGIPGSLAEVGLTARDLPEMARECIERYPRPNNPVPITAAALMPLLDRFQAGGARSAWDAASAAW